MVVCVVHCIMIWATLVLVLLARPQISVIPLRARASHAQQCCCRLSVAAVNSSFIGLRIHCFARVMTAATQDEGRPPHTHAVQSVACQLPNSSGAITRRACCHGSLVLASSASVHPPNSSLSLFLVLRARQCWLWHQESAARRRPQPMSRHAR